MSHVPFHPAPPTLPDLLVGTRVRANETRYPRIGLAHHDGPKLQITAGIINLGEIGVNTTIRCVAFYTVGNAPEIHLGTTEHSLGLDPPEVDDTTENFEQVILGELDYPTAADGSTVDESGQTAQDLPNITVRVVVDESVFPPFRESRAGRYVLASEVAQNVSPSGWNPYRVPWLGVGRLSESNEGNNETIQAFEYRTGAQGNRGCRKF